MAVMRTWCVIAAAAVAAAGAAWAADVAIDGRPCGRGGVSAPPAHDAATFELKWDNGRVRWVLAWYTGAGSWVGNDFDATTLKTRYVKILKFRMYTDGKWPNSSWDGFRIGIFDLAGGVPGSRLWPTAGEGRFFKPGREGGEGWVECAVDWNCPALKFVAAQQQYYNWPNCDPFSVDTNRTFLKHSWEYYRGTWAPLSTVGNPYRNLMIRVRVEKPRTFPGVAPSSIGRVKALYY